MRFQRLHHTIRERLRAPSVPSFLEAHKAESQLLKQGRCIGVSGLHSRRPKELPSIGEILLTSNTQK